MAKYFEKPVVIDAVQWNSDLDLSEYPIWLKDAINEDKVLFSYSGGLRFVEIFASETKGDSVAYENDYIIRGVDGEIYLCNKDFFEQNYEKVED